MSILICCSGCFGGTDFLLKRYYEWLINNSVEADIVSPNEIPIMKMNKYYDVIILPSSQMNILPKLKRKGYNFKSILIWIMGCGSFKDTYYNPDRDKGFEKISNKILGYLADRFIIKLYKNHNICFTDEVGMHVSLQDTRLPYKEKIDANIIPIAITIPKERLIFKKNTTSPLRLCWIGRISKDFKVIPIKHLLNDVEEYAKHSDKELELTIVGTGEGLSEIKNIAIQKDIVIKFIENVEYNEIGNFLNTHVDILIAMGTSALDGAKFGCPSVIITPVKPSNKEIVDYRWIYESRGYSLGEYPDIVVELEQVKKSFTDICIEYETKEVQELSYRYALKFDEDKVFEKLYDRNMKHTNKLTNSIWIHVYIFTTIKFIKNICKKILGLVKNIG